MISANLVPMVIDTSSTGERAFDIYSLLLKERIIFLGTAIDAQVSSLVVAQLLYLNSLDPKRQIDLYIQSPGGEVYAGLAIYDAMQMISAPVSTVSLGFTGSMATGILASGATGRRFALSHATIHLHPAGGGAKGYTEDVQIATREQERLQTQLFHIIGKHAGHTWQELEEFFRRDRYLNAVEAKTFGLIDEIMGSTEDLIRIDRPSFQVLSAVDNKQALPQAE